MPTQPFVTIGDNHFELHQNSTNGIDFNFSCNNESDVISINILYYIADMVKDRLF